jgi:tetratricopeptide (TPR) repeat protein
VPPHAHLTVGPLTAADVASLLRSAGGHASLAAPIAARTGGNAFFVQQVMRHLATVGWETGVGLGFGVTDDVAQFVRQRLNPLPAPAQEALLVGAVLGGPFDLTMLIAVTGIGVEALVDGLEAAIRAGFVVEPAMPGAYRFTHELVRDAIYQDVSPTRRALIHRQVAETLEAQPGLLGEERVTVLAQHLLAAGSLGPPERASEYAIAAGRRAMAALTFDEAATWFERAMDAVPAERRQNQDEHLGILLELSVARSHGGQHVAAAEVARRAAQLAKLRVDGDWLARAVLALEEACWRGGIDDPTLPALFDHALDALPADHVQRRVELLGQFYRGKWRTRPASLRQRAEEAYALAHELADPRLEMLALAGRNAAGYRLTDLDRRRRDADRIVRLATEIGSHEFEINPGRAWLVECAVLTGDLDELDRQLEAARRAARIMRQPAYTFHLLVGEAMRELLLGNLAAAEAVIDEGWRIAEANLGAAGRFYHTVQLLFLRYEQGRLSELEEEVAACAADGPLASLFTSALAWLSARLGRLDDASTTLAEVVPDGLPDDWHCRFMTAALAAETVALVGDVDAAAVLEDVLTPLAGYVAMCEPATVAMGSAARPLAGLLALQRRYDEAVEAYELALTMNERMGARSWVAHTCHEFAEVLAARGGRDDERRAQALLGRASQLADELGLTALGNRLKGC